MKKQPIEYSKNVIFINAFSKIFVAASTIASILSFLGYTINKNQRYIILSVCLITLTIWIFFMRNVISVKLMTILMSYTIPDTNIEIKNKRVIYGYKKPDKLFFQSKFLIKVRNTAIRCLEDNKLRWTAGSIGNIEPLIPGQSIKIDEKLTMTQIGCEKQAFSIRFQDDREITKNDDWEPTGFKIPVLDDPEQKSKTSLCIGVYDRTYDLYMKVFFAEGMNPHGIRLKKYAHFIDNEPYEVEAMPILYDKQYGNSYVEATIKKPIYGGKYEIDWMK